MPTSKVCTHPDQASLVLNIFSKTLSMFFGPYSYTVYGHVLCYSEGVGVFWEREGWRFDSDQEKHEKQTI